MFINELRKLKGKYCVYVLKHPLSREIFYVGVTYNPLNRKRFHSTSQTDRQPKLKKILDDLREEKNVPLFEIIGVFDNKQVAYSMEATVIKKMNPIANTMKK